MKEALASRAAEEGFAAMGVCDPAGFPDLGARLARFVAEGQHGSMGWMAERMHWRGDPAALWPEARSVVMLADLYPGGIDPAEASAARDRGVISAYAKGRDYHDVVKKRLKRLGRWLIETGGGDIKVFVDTAPVMEKPLAAAAGLGWQGKHTNLVSRDLGNWFFLGAIFTTLQLERDAPGEDRCGSCRACLDACPTGAFPAPYRLDARRCISYLTIEHAGPVEEALRPMLGNRIYGCDDCLAVCPWNKFAQAAQQMAYAPRPGTELPELARLAALDNAGFRQLFAGSPVKRIGRARFLRNVAYAIGNSGEAALAPSVAPLVQDPDPVLAEAAGWALARL